MRRTFCFIILVCFSALPRLTVAEEPVIPRWVDPLGREPLSGVAWLEANPERAHGDGVESGRRAYPPAGRAAGDLLVIVEDRLSAALDSELVTWYADLSAEGWSVDERLYTGGDAAAVRSVIQGAGADGVILLGQLPVPWFEMDEPDWGYLTHEEFPCDLYYMDLDGVWADNDGDGLLDSHTGDLTPELWVARISAREQTFGLEIDLLRGYFAKNHQYRTAGLGVPDRALAYNDDDWAYYGYEDGLDEAYGDLTVYNSYGTTTADHLLERYTAGYEFVHLMSHSSPWGHTFKVPGGYAGSVFNYEIEALLPEAVFVKLFSCSCTRFVEFDNIGNWYIFHEGPGLVSLGSAKTGSMLSHDEFYVPLSTGLSIGEAYEDWSQNNIYPGMSPYYKAWYYGLNILGDGTLTLHGGSRERPLTGWQRPAPRNANFEDWAEVSTSPHSDVAPVLVGTTGGAWCAWVSAEQGRSSVYVSELTDGWSSPAALDSATYWEYGPALARNGDEVHCVFSRFGSETYDYDLYHSVNDGAGWTTPQQIRRLDGYDLYPALCAVDGELRLVWQKWTGSGCYLMTSSYTGSWSEPVRLGADRGAEPALCPDGAGGLRLAYQGRDNNTACEIRLRHDDGAGWSAPEVLPGTAENPAHPELLRSADGTLWCAFEDLYEETTAVYVSRNPGDGWQPPVRLTDDGLAAHRPRPAEGADGVVCVFWADDGSDRGAYICEYDDGWQNPERLSESGSQSWDPAVTVAGDGRLTTAWQQFVDGDLQIVAAAEPETEIADIRLTATIDDGGLLVDWRVEGDPPAALRVLRGQEYPVDVSGALDGTVNRWLDRDIEPGESYVYWLEATDTTGRINRFGPTEDVVAPETAERLSLAVPFPSPARDTLTLCYTLPAGCSSATLTVYDLSGRRISTQPLEAVPGRHSLLLDIGGYPQGIYLARLEGAGAAAARRFVVSR